MTCCHIDPACCDGDLVHTIRSLRPCVVLFEEGEREAVERVERIVKEVLDSECLRANESMCVNEREGEGEERDAKDESQVVRTKRECKVDDDGDCSYFRRVCQVVVFLEMRIVPSSSSSSSSSHSSR